jgi:hypothetical protein
MKCPAVGVDIGKNLFQQEPVHLVGRTHPVPYQRVAQRGDTYVRSLLFRGARSALMHAKHAGTWGEQIQQRRPSREFERSARATNVGRVGAFGACSVSGCKQAAYQGATYSVESNSRNLAHRGMHRGRNEMVAPASERLRL